MSVPDRDNGAGALRERLAELSKRGGVQLTVGVHADTGAAKHPSGGDVAEVAAILELGTDTKAPRGFLRNTIDEQRPRLGEKIAEGGRRILEGSTVEEGFGPVVRDLVGDVRARVPVDTATVRDAVEGRVQGVRVA